MSRAFDENVYKNMNGGDKIIHFNYVVKNLKKRFESLLRKGSHSTFDFGVICGLCGDFSVEICDLTKKLNVIESTLAYYGTMIGVLMKYRNTPRELEMLRVLDLLLEYVTKLDVQCRIGDSKEEYEDLEKTVFPVCCDDE